MRAIIFICQLLIAVRVMASVYEVDFNKHPFPGQWRLPEGFSYDSTGGESGSGALRYSKNIGDPYVIASHRIKVEPGAKYRLSMMARGEAIKNFEGKGLFAVEYKKNGSHVSGNYYSMGKGGVLQDGVWKELVLEVSPPEDFDVAAISFFLGKAVAGTIWYDNLRLEKTGAVPPDIFDFPPSNLTVRGSDAELAFRAVVYQPIPLNELEMKITSGGVESRIRPDSNAYFRVSPRGLTPGKLPVTVELRRIADGQTLGSAEFNYFVTNAKASANASSVGTDGFTMVNGERFLPIGFYCRNINSEMLKRVSEAGANFIMPYAIGREGNIAEKLDLAWKYHLRVLFNVMYQHENAKSKVVSHGAAQGIDEVLKAWVKEFRSHPALLGWYLSDENPRHEIPRLRQMREMINAIDPDHFTVTLTYRPIDFPAFINTGDVFATDPYPIETVASRSMAHVHRLINGASALTPRVWMVPQAFNWGAYRKHENPAQPYRFPSEAEIRSMVLSGAVNGAKGFLFYSYDSIFGRGEKKYPGSAENNWDLLVPAVKLLKELAPFFLSTEPAPPVTVVKGNGCRARAWTRDGKIKVIITGDGPGDVDALIEVPDAPSLKSRYGLTRNLGGGKYAFTGRDICSDILE